MARLHQCDMDAQNLDENTVCFTVWSPLRGKKSKDFKRDDKTVKQVAKWIRRQHLGDADENDILNLLSLPEPV